MNALFPVKKSICNDIIGSHSATRYSIPQNDIVQKLIKEQKTFTISKWNIKSVTENYCKYVHFSSLIPWLPATVVYVTTTAVDFQSQYFIPQQLLITAS